MGDLHLQLEKLASVSQENLVVAVCIENRKVYGMQWPWWCLKVLARSCRWEQKLSKPQIKRFHMRVKSSKLPNTCSFCSDHNHVWSSISYCNLHAHQVIITTLASPRALCWTELLLGQDCIRTWMYFSRSAVISGANVPFEISSLESFKCRFWKTMHTQEHRTSFVVISLWVAIWILGKSDCWHSHQLSLKTNSRWCITNSTELSCSGRWWFCLLVHGTTSQYYSSSYFLDVGKQIVKVCNTTLVNAIWRFSIWISNFNLEAAMHHKPQHADILSQPGS